METTTVDTEILLFQGLWVPNILFYGWRGNISFLELSLEGVQLSTKYSEFIGFELSPNLFLKLRLDWVRTRSIWGTLLITVPLLGIGTVITKLRETSFFKYLFPSYLLCEGLHISYTYPPRPTPTPLLRSLSFISFFGLMSPILYLDFIYRCSTGLIFKFYMVFSNMSLLFSRLTENVDTLYPRLNWHYRRRHVVNGSELTELVMTSSLINMGI